jgi:glycosyltransferase involved in cell wall biosynthesis
LGFLPERAKVKIGLIIYDNLDIISGGYLYDRILYRYLQKRGEEVEIFSLPRRGYFQNIKDNFSKSFYQKVKHFKPDILLQDELNHPSLFLLNKRLKKTLSCPLVAIVHNLHSSEKHPSWTKYFYQRIEKRYLSSVDAYIINSLTTLESVKRLTGVVKPSVIARPGKDHLLSDITENQIIERARQDGPLQILFVGNVIPHKGLHILIDALVLLPSEDWELIVVGNLEIDPPYLRSINRQIAKRKIQNKIELAGLISGEPLKKAFLKGQILAVPSMYEGFGIVYLEAMGFGMPCIATSSGAPKEFITHGKEGFLVNPGDSFTLSQLIQKLMDNRELLLDMSLNALKKYQAHNTWEQSSSFIHQFVKAL